MQPGIFSFVIFLTIAVSGVIGSHKGYQLLALSINTEEQVTFLMRMNNAIASLGLEDEVEFFTQPSIQILKRNKSVQLMVSPSKKQSVIQALEEQKISYRIVIADLAREIEEQSKPDERDQGAPDISSMTWTAYHKFATIENFMLGLARDYPSIVNITDIGKSYEGRILYLVKVGKPQADGATKPAIWIDSLLHAREWISGATTTFMLDKLVTEYATNSTCKEMVDAIDFYFMPVYNPDGYDYSHINESTRLWRKSRRVNPFSDCLGVDGNRNFDFYWMGRGSSQDPCLDNYAGDFGFSDPENLAISDAILERKDQIKAFLTFHSAAQSILLPWGYTKEPLPDYQELVDLGRRAADAIWSQFQTYFVADSLFVLAGDLVLTSGADDWAKGKGMIKYVYTIELRDQGTYEFLLPPDQIIPSGIETFEALVVIAQTVSEKFGSGPIITPDNSVLTISSEIMLSLFVLILSTLFPLL